jgi:NADH-quinone oxidoreductase subunit J
MDPISFSVLAAVAVLAALTVVLHPDPVYSALGLVVMLLVLAVFFIGLDAHLIAALQVIVYAGAIMVLFLFVIMLLGRPAPGGPWSGRPSLWFVAILGSAALAVGVAKLSAQAPLAAGAPAPPGFGTATALGVELFTTYLLPFELTSVLLLVAVIGAVVLTRGRS